MDREILEENTGVNFINIFHALFCRYFSAKNYKAVWSTFVQNFGAKNALLYKKCARKKLMKLTTGVLWNTIDPIIIFFHFFSDYSTQQLSAIAEQQFNSGEIDGLSLDKGQSSNLRSDVTGDHHSRKYSTSLTDISSYATARCRAQSSLFLSLLFVSISHQILLSQSNRWWNRSRIKIFSCFFLFLWKKKKTKLKKICI